MKVQPLRLGVNIDHVATIRNARGGLHPDPIRAAHMAVLAGADGITAHLREDRRHIRDQDMERLKRQLFVPLNFEMAATDEMIGIAARIRPHAACLVPGETGGADDRGRPRRHRRRGRLRSRIAALRDEGIRVSLFVEPEPEVMQAAGDLGAPVVELHTGPIAKPSPTATTAASPTSSTACAGRRSTGPPLGLEVHAGHGLTFDSVRAVAAIPQIVELNIGHSSSARRSSWASTRPSGDAPPWTRAEGGRMRGARDRAARPIDKPRRGHFLP